MLTARRSIRMTACGFLPRNRGTPCAESGLQKRKRKAITTVSPTKASGRFAILRTRGRFFGFPTGSITRRQTGSLRAVLEEMDGTEQPVLLAQDYHFGLLPRLVKKARPDARVAI